jgi:hypothetical protein
MPSLADTQARLRAALVEGDAAAIVPVLVGGRDPAKRVAIHRRHYVKSLVTALLGKFPAVCWLMGHPFAIEAAEEFIRHHPPTAPCIAEYGADFPEFLADRRGAERIPYLRSFAELEWHLGHISIAVDHPALGMDAFGAMSADALPDLVLALQPGLHYLSAPWPIDELMKLYLTETAPDHYVFEPAETRIEVRGARGDFRINRLDGGTFAFRSGISGGASIGAAAERGLDSDAAFDPGRALTMLVDDGLVTAIMPLHVEAP